MSPTSRRPHTHPTPSSVVVGVDTGGTFTDIVLLEPDGALRVLKVPSTPDDPSRAIVEGLRQTEAGRGQEAEGGWQGGIQPGFTLIHGTTVATNALLERRGARTALITTQGCRDVLEIGRQTRSELYSLSPLRRIPLIPRELRFEVPERMDWRGEVVTPLDTDAVEAVLDAIQAEGVESVAVCFLFSFLNPAHEREAGRRAAARGLAVSLSCDIAPEFREYERTSTVCANAYVAPVMGRYIDRLREGVTALGAGRLSIMQSSGGTLRAQEAAQNAIKTVLSGPAGGLVAAVHVAQQAGFPRIMSFDMGGTSTDVALAEVSGRGEGEQGRRGRAGGGVGERTSGRVGETGFQFDSRHSALDSGSPSPLRPPEPPPARDSEGRSTFSPSVVRTGEIAGLPLLTPMLDIHTVGAGGGSIARIDAGGGLRVGPRSAGADPGPVAYGRGEELTVTDANVMLGRLPSHILLAGSLPLDTERVRVRFAELARNLARGPEEAAEGIIAVVNAQMARALRHISVERGRNPADYALVSFGGAGGLHACALAELVGMKHVLVPRDPGAFSALGLVLADVRREYARTLLFPMADPAPDVYFQCITDQAARAGADLTADGVAPDHIAISSFVEARYVGQSYALRVPAHRKLSAVARAFHREHRDRYGYSDPSQPVEIVTVGISASGSARSMEPAAPALPSTEGKPDSVRVWLEASLTTCSVYDRHTLPAGYTLNGPAILTQPDATTWLARGWRATVDAFGNLLLAHP